ncbi:hypothetical protein SI65_07035 [Aspergillus cristatus]|uniref:Uncharacterized protein n=1 Tax=Aspergillus cristatus TaxID=573508 RepID=A0A1E3B8Q8_ASPCR|nr:hypothetical protein SI65_07035 [Aspergillus cristatus]
MKTPMRPSLMTLPAGILELIVNAALPEDNSASWANIKFVCKRFEAIFSRQIFKKYISEDNYAPRHLISRDYMIQLLAQILRTEVKVHDKDPAFIDQLFYDKGICPDGYCTGQISATGVASSYIEAVCELSLSHKRMSQVVRNKLALVSLVAQGADVNVNDEWLGPPLNAAVCGGHLSIVQFLLNHKADINFRVYQGSPLILAAHKKDKRMVRLLLGNDEIDPGRTQKEPAKNALLEDNDAHNYQHMARDMLCWAAKHGRVSVWPDISPNPPPGHDNYCPPSYFAAVNGHHAIVRLLLQRSNIRPNLKYAGQMPLHAAIQYGNNYIAQLLLEHKAVDRNAKDGYHRTPLSAAIWSGRTKTACLILQQLGINITFTDCHGRTAASYAAQRRRRLRFILEHRGGILNKQDKFGFTGLIMAVRKGRLGVVRVLLEFGAGVRSKDKNGRTALWLARESKYRNRDIEKVLVETMGSNPE